MSEPELTNEFLSRFVDTNKDNIISAKEMFAQPSATQSDTMENNDGY